MSKLLDLWKSVKSSSVTALALSPWAEQLSSTVAELLTSLGTSDADIAALTQVVEGSEISTTTGFAYITQTDWAVDSVNGNDDGAGTSADPLKTLAELGRRWRGRTFHPAVASMTVALRGTFSTEKLVLNAAFPGASTIQLGGQMTTVDTGTITTYTAQNAATNTRSNVNDAGQDFSTLRRTRIRSTSGAVTDAVTWCCPTAAASNADSFVGQFSGTTATGLASQNPANGTTYAIESFNTQVAGFDIDLAGNATLIIRDVEFSSPTGAVVRSFGRVGASNVFMRLFGCQFSGPGAHVVIGGAVEYGGCASVNGLFNIGQGFHRLFNHVFFSQTSLAQGCQILSQNNIHDGGGTANVTFTMTIGTAVLDIASRGFFGNSAGDALLTVSEGAFFSLTGGSTVLWGGIAPSGTNVATTAVRIRTQSSLEWQVLPTIVASSPGVTDIIYGGTAANWAAVAGGVINATNGACAAPRA